MDLQTLMTNKEELEKLSREYEVLKASGADVDYTAWVRLRLREAAAQLSSGNTIDQPGTSAAAAPRAAGAEHTGLATVKSPEHQISAGATQPTLAPPQLGFSRRLGRPPAGAASYGTATQQPHGWIVHGEGASPLQKASTKGKRVTIVSPQSTAKLQPQQQRKPAQQRQRAKLRPAAQPPSLSKLYSKQQPDLFTFAPDASVHPLPRPERGPAAAQRPDWVNTASLQAALRSGSAIPHLQAAAERERRLAASVALARQGVAAALEASDPDEPSSLLYGLSPAAQAVQAEYENVKAMTAQLAKQNEQLAAAMQENTERLRKQQELLEAALLERGTSGAEAPAQPHVPSAGTTAVAVGTERSTASIGLQAFGSEPSTAAPSTQAAATAAAAPPPVTRLTTKEADKLHRKEQLKAIIKQMLRPAEGGRRQLPSSVEEVEKLVATLTTLASANKPRRTAADSRRVGAALVGQENAAIPVDAAQPMGKEPGTAPAVRAPKAPLRSNAVSQLLEQLSRQAAAPSREASRASALLSREASRAPARSPSREASSAWLPQSTEPSRGPLASREASRAALLSREASRGPLASREASRAAMLSREASRAAMLSREVSRAALAEEALMSRADSLGREASRGVGPSRGTSRSALLSKQTSKSSLRRELLPDGATSAVGVAAPDSSAPPERSEWLVQQQLPRAQAEAAGAGAGGAALMVETLEDQVQQIVERDAASFAEANRVRRLELLEQRMYSLIDKVGDKLQAALQPLHANLQLDEQLFVRQRQLQLHDSSGTGTASAGAAADAATQAAATAGMADSGGFDRAAQLGHMGIGVMHAGDPAGLSVLALHRMLINLNHMDDREKEMRRKWLHGGSGRQLSPPRPPPPVVVRDGQLGTLPGPATAAATSAHAHTRSPPGTPKAPSLWAAPIKIPTATAPSGHTTASVAAQDGSGSQRLAAGADAVSAETLDAVLYGRKKFLAHQRQQDGMLVSAANPGLNPISVVEDVADLLLDDLLMEHAEELTDLCDDMGAKLYEVEFEPPDPQPYTQQATPRHHA